MNCTVAIQSLLSHAEPQLFVIIAENMIITLVLLDIY